MINDHYEVMSDNILHELYDWLILLETNRPLGLSLAFKIKILRFAINKIIYNMSTFVE